MAFLFLKKDQFKSSWNAYKILKLLKCSRNSTTLIIIILRKAVHISRRVDIITEHGFFFFCFRSLMFLADIISSWKAYQLLVTLVPCYLHTFNVIRQLMIIQVLFCKFSVFVFLLMIIILGFLSFLKVILFFILQ